MKKTQTKFSAKLLEKSDAELVEQCRRGDETAWDELVERYQRLIFAIPRRAGLSEAQSADVFQEVFLTLFEKLNDIEQPEKIRSWLVTTAKFKTWGMIRGERNFHSPATDEEMESEMTNLKDESPLVEDALIEMEEQHLIRTALTKLDERCRTILQMIYLDDERANYAKVAERIGVAATGISPMRVRCLKKLEKILSK